MCARQPTLAPERVMAVDLHSSQENRALARLIEGVFRLLQCSPMFPSVIHSFRSSVNQLTPWLMSRLTSPRNQIGWRRFIVGGLGSNNHRAGNGRSQRGSM